MSRPIEEVVAEAQVRLERAGTLDIEAYVRLYPEHATELRALLETMQVVHREKQWQVIEQKTGAFASNLFAQLGATSPTVGELFSRASAEGIAPSLPPTAVEALSKDQTPVDRLDNSAIKELAGKIAVRVDHLLKEVKRLRSLERLWSASAAPIMTRHKEESSQEEQQALLDKVKQHVRKPPEGQ